MSDPAHHAEPTRRFWQYRLRTLLILVALVACLLAVWQTFLAPYHRQRETMALVADLGGTCKTEAAETWLRRIYGEDFQNVVLVDLADCDDPDAYLPHVAALPRLRTLVVGGHDFTDEHLRPLHGTESLRGLVLDYTRVTDDGIERLQRALPNLVVHHSQRRAIAIVRLLSDGDNGDVGTIQRTERSLLQQIVGNKHCEDAVNVGLEGCKAPNLGIHLNDMVRLGDLDLGSSSIVDADLRHLKRLTSLRILYLRHTKVTDAGLAHIKGLTSLMELHLGDTQVTGAGLVHLKGMRKLEWLYLQDTRLSDEALGELSGLTNLRLLNLRRTGVTDAGVKKLRAALPRCNIHSQ